MLAALVSVPEATVDEDRKSEVFEDKVRPSGQIGRVLGELEFQAPQHSFTLVLSGRSCRMNGPHDPATLCFGEGIHRTLTAW